MPNPQRLSLLLIALMLAGCAGQQAREADAPYLAEAESRLKSADFIGASHIYQQLADSSSAPDYYRLLAADAELRGGNNRMAQALMSGIDEDELQREDRYRLQLLKSRMDLNQGRAREAMAKLDLLTGVPLEPAALAHYHTLRASAYNQMGKMVESARERVFLGQLLNNPEAIRKNNEAIFDTLGHIPDATLPGVRESRADTLGGWLALSQASRAPTAQRGAALQAWRAQYPGHPANGAFVEALMPKQQPGKGIEIKALKTEAPVAQAQAPQPRSETAPPAGAGRFIVVLLPLSGNFAPAGQALRAGISAAHEADPNPAKPELRFIDAQGGAVVEKYRQASGEGAEFVIGPLLKDEVAALAQSGELAVPVLALNQNPEVGQDKLYQFGLTPEQEVEQSAGSAWFDGRQSALVLAPASSFGQRMISHFSTYWKSLGGKVAAVKTYQPGGNDFTAPVQSLLANQAQAPADFVFMIADPRDARLLKPQLDTQQTGSLPVYATSHAYSGRGDAGLDRELNGVIFCDAPWLLNTSDTGPLSRQALEGALQQTPETYTRLIAMGVDAYNLVPRLSQMKTSPQTRYNGATGTLNLLAGNRIQRQLHCAQFEGGTLQPRGIAPLLQPGTAPAAGTQ